MASTAQRQAVATPAGWQPALQGDTMGPMQIAQLVIHRAPPYELKSQRIDREQLGRVHSVETWTHAGASVTSPTGQRIASRGFARALGRTSAELLHVYGPGELPPVLFHSLRLPWVASGLPARTKISMFRPTQPAITTSPVGKPPLPEAVEIEFLDSAPPAPESGPRKTIGSYAGSRPGVRALCEAAVARLGRFRDDVDWLLFDAPPSPSEMAALDLWVDPATSPEDLGGLTAEALALGMLVVASRTEVNCHRLLDGRCGFLVPPGDPNELTHVVAQALFRPDLGEARRQEARATAERFAPSHRASRLLEIYESVLHATQR